MHYIYVCNYTIYTSIYDIYIYIYICIYMYKNIFIYKIYDICIILFLLVYCRIVRLIILCQNVCSPMIFMT